MSRPTEYKKRPNLSFFGLENAKRGNSAASAPTGQDATDEIAELGTFGIFYFFQ